MPRVTTKKNAAIEAAEGEIDNGDPYTCCQCPEPITAGEQYFEWSFRYGGTYRQHISHGSPKQSQLTQSKMSSAYAVHLLETIKEIANDDGGEKPPATAEGQPEQFRDLTPPRTRKRRSDGGLRRPCAGPPTTPESAPALTITEVTAPDNAPQGDDALGYLPPEYFEGLT